MIGRMSTQTLERPPATPRGGRGASFWIGVGLILAGLAVLGYVAWQFFGTNVVAHQKQQRIVEQTEKVWSSAGGVGATGAAKGVQLRGAEALIRIPRFGRKYVMPVQKGVSEQVLAEGFGHFEGTARAGGVGNFALAAHRVTHGEPLRNMPSLQVGDKINVETRDATYTYVLTTGGDDLRVTFHDGWVVDPRLPSNPDRGGVEPDQLLGQKLITLTTCAELFHTDDRLVAFGILKSESDKGVRLPG
jgi:sortase A